MTDRLDLFGKRRVGRQGRFDFGTIFRRPFPQGVGRQAWIVAIDWVGMVIFHFIVFGVRFSVFGLNLPSRVGLVFRVR